MASQQLPFSYPQRTARGAEDFLITSSNQNAVQWIDRWPDWPSNTLILLGPEGSGKTHLAHVWQERTNAHYLTADDLKSTHDMWPAGHYIVEDLDAKPLTSRQQTELFHLYNWLREGQFSLLLTSRTPPAQWKICLPDLISRLKSPQTAILKDPEDELLGGVIVKMFNDRQITISIDVLNYILRHMDRTLATAKNLVIAIDNRAFSEKRGITIPLVKAVIGDLRKTDARDLGTTPK
ncbi:MAG: DNA replication protein [Kordiimonas sp.]|nr:DNA replication protein [Kordiimonas sp.]|tara:strand:+ start:4747 stop:5454 length:708 start_codon:yes stop_codon:yes gene_type:complete